MNPPHPAEAEADPEPTPAEPESSAVADADPRPDPEPTPEFEPGPAEAAVGAEADVDLAFEPAAETAPDSIGFLVPPPAAEPPIAGPDPAARAIEAMAGDLGRRLDALQTLFEREVRAEGTREKVVDRLHAELQEYKQGLAFGILRPVFVDLVRLHDDLGKAIEAADRTPPDPARLPSILANFRQDVEDILYRQGVEPFTRDESDAFDPRHQRALSTVPTDDPALNKRVAARVRPGFQAGEKVIRPEMVQVYAHKPAAAGPAAEQDS